MKIAAIQTMNIIIALVFLLAITAGVIILQIYLSKKEGKWLGLILPIITFVISIMVVMSMAVFVASPSFTVQEYVDGQWVTTYQDGYFRQIPGAIWGVISVFLLTNISTAILLVIYAAVRSKNKRQRDLDKMSVQDL